MPEYKNMNTPRQFELHRLAQRYRRLANLAKMRGDWDAVNKYLREALNISKDIVYWS